MDGTVSMYPSTVPRLTKQGLLNLYPSKVTSAGYCHRFLWLSKTRPDVEFHGWIRQQEAEESAEEPSLDELGMDDVGADGLPDWKSPLDQMEEDLAAGREAAMRNWPVQGTYGPFVLSGHIDSLRFTRTAVNLILDYKAAENDKHYPRQVLQVQLYGLLMELDGKDISNLFVGVASVARNYDPHWAKADDGDLHMETNADEIEPAAVRLRTEMLRKGLAQATKRGDGWSIYLYRYEPTEVRRRLDAFAGAMSRKPPDPIGATPRKCAACHFNGAGVCPVALVPAKPGFVVSKKCGKTIVQRIPVRDQ